MHLDHPAVSKRVFHPRGTAVPADLTVPVPGAELGCYVRRREGSKGMLLHFHGNGETAAEYAEGFADVYLEWGLDVCFVEYRGYGRSTGRPALAAMRGDGLAVATALELDPAATVVFGRSLGSLYAVELAARLPVAGLILDSGIAAVGEIWPLRDEFAAAGAAEVDPAEELAAEFDQAAKLARFTGRLLVLHTEQDRLVPRSHADRLHAWGAGDDKRLQVFPRGDHNSIFLANLREYGREVHEFLGRCGLK